jgi:ABC-type transporter Mla subunit MlaD
MNIHHYIHYDQHDEHKIIKLLNQIIMEQSEFAQKLNELKDQAAKAKAEIIKKIEDLGTALDAADDVTPEVQAAFDALKTEVQGVDDIVPDAPTT